MSKYFFQLFVVTYDLVTYCFSNYIMSLSIQVNKLMIFDVYIKIIYTFVLIIIYYILASLLT
jgi:hypothetical protein